MNILGLLGSRRHSSVSPEPNRLTHRLVELVQAQESAIEETRSRQKRLRAEDDLDWIDCNVPLIDDISSSFLGIVLMWCNRHHLPSKKWLWIYETFSCDSCLFEIGAILFHRINSWHNDGERHHQQDAILAHLINDFVSHYERILDEIDHSRTDAHVLLQNRFQAFNAIHAQTHINPRFFYQQIILAAATQRRYSLVPTADWERFLILEFEPSVNRGVATIMDALLDRQFELAKDTLMACYPHYDQIVDDVEE